MAARIAITNEQILEDLRHFRSETGRIPAANDFQKGRAVTVPTIRKRFKTWNNAIKKAFPATRGKPKSVIISGKVSLYKDKAPFVESGKSILGALEYDESSGMVRCHECGKMVLSLPRHLHQEHNIKARDYKIKHGLKIATCLYGEHTRNLMVEAAMRRSAGMPRRELLKKLTAMSHLADHKKQGATLRKTRDSLRNERGMCRAQLLEKLNTLAVEFGRTPTQVELIKNGIQWNTLQFHFGSAANAMKIAGLTPNTKQTRTMEQRFPTESLLRSLRMFSYNNRRIPRLSDCRRGLLTCSPRHIAQDLGHGGRRWLRLLP